MMMNVYTSCSVKPTVTIALEKDFGTDSNKAVYNILRVNNQSINTDGGSNWNYLGTFL